MNESLFISVVKNYCNEIQLDDIMHIYNVPMALMLNNIINFVYCMHDYKKKTSGAAIRRTLDIKLRFVGVNVGHIQ